MSVEAKAKELIGSMNSLIGEYINMLGGVEIMNLDADEFKLIKQSMDLVKLSSEMMLEQAKALDSINCKLDRLISREEKIESYTMD